MRTLTSFRVGGPADRVVVAESLKQAAAVLKAAASADVPVMLLGNGSNVLVSDQGIRGVLLLLGGEFRKIELLEDNRTIVCGAGASLASLARFAQKHGLTGLEFAWGIPGSVGGAVYMNAGAYGGEMKDVVKSAGYLSRKCEAGTYKADELDFAYRQSVFKDTDLIITDAAIYLEPGDRDAIEEKMELLMEKRKVKQPYALPSAGSTFKRPEGHYAAALIEDCGLKGISCGDAQVSPKHAGFVVNNGNATCAQVCALIAKIKQRVYEMKGIALDCEVKLIGEGFDEACMKRESLQMK